jgi:hypothetical protein
MPPQAKNSATRNLHRLSAAILFVKLHMSRQKAHVNMPSVLSCRAAQVKNSATCNLHRLSAAILLA